MFEQNCCAAEHKLKQHYLMWYTNKKLLTLKLNYYVLVNAKTY